MKFVFLCSKDICICLVGQIDFNVSETCKRFAIHEALLQRYLLSPQNCSISHGKG